MYGDIPYSNTLRYSDTLITRHIHFLNLYVDTVYIYIYVTYVKYVHMSQQFSQSIDFSQQFFFFRPWKVQTFGPRSVPTKPQRRWGNIQNKQTSLICLKTGANLTEPTFFLHFLSLFRHCFCMFQFVTYSDSATCMRNGQGSRSNTRKLGPVGPAACPNLDLESP